MKSDLQIVNREFQARVAIDKHNRAEIRYLSLVNQWT